MSASSVPSVLPIPTAAPSSSSASTTPAAATTTTPTTTTTNAATSARLTSSPTTTSTSSTATSVQSSSTSTTTTSSPTSTAQFVTTSGGTVVTVTTIITPSASTTSTSQNNSTSSNSFFSNKGAVAGVFSVVGLIVVALIIALVVNAIRRRRAQKFDRDVAEAAAEAAASRSPFDDYSYANTGGKGGGGGGGGYGYSDNSHGTYQLPPLQPQPHTDPYSISEMSQYDPYAAGAASLAAAAAVGRSRSRKDSEPGTPGIAGVGAGTLAREPSKRAPYHAFAGPGPQPHELQGSNGTIRSPRGTNQDVLEAAGLAGPGAAAIASNNLNSGVGGAFVTRKPSETTQNTHFSGRSQFGSMSSGHHPTTLQPGYPVESYYPQRNDNHSPDPFATYPPVTTVSKPLPNPHAILPSPPLPGPQSDHNEDLAELGSQTALRSEEQRMSYQDDTDYSQGNRVLRVANE